MSSSNDSDGPTYESLAKLRQALSADERGRMLDAADTVRDAGISVDAVLSDRPPVADLADAGIVPPETQATPAAEHRQRMIDLLEQIADNTGGSS